MNTERINVDFQVIPTLDPNYITLVDHSNWGIISDKPTIVEVVIPGEEKPVTHYFKQSQVNILNSINLGINCVNNEGVPDLVELPDGIYDITLKGSPSKFSKNRIYLRTVKTELELDKLFIKANLECDKLSVDFMDKLLEIKFLLLGAESNIRYNNRCEAQELLFEAQRLIDRAMNCIICK